MSDIKRIALIFLIVTLFFNSFSNFAYAADDYNHSELLEYEGYGQAMYESIVEQTTFVTGQYTDNKNYVSQSIDEIVNYANTWKDEYNNWDASCNGDFIGCMRSMVEGVGGYALTVGDWIKNLFKGYDETENPVQTEHPYQGYFHSRSGGGIAVAEGYYFTVGIASGSKTYINFAWESTIRNTTDGYRVSSSVNTEYVRTGLANIYKPTTLEAEAVLEEFRANSNNVNYVLNKAEQVWDITVYKQDTKELMEVDSGIPNQAIKNISNYIQENGVSSVQLPQLKPSLVCPDGTKIQMSVSGSTFIGVDGTTMVVSKDGTAEINGALCNLNWEKPVVQYNPINGNPEIIQPDGTKTDLATGETETAPVKPPSHTDLQGCDGVMCAIGKLLDGIGNLVGAITGMVKSLLDGILGLFVPDDLSFISEEFGRITDSLTDKIAITEDLKDMLTGMFTDDATNPLQDITIDLPIVGKPLQFGDMSLINEGVPMLKKVISAICILYTLIYVYRKITGKGGVMEK